MPLLKLRRRYRLALALGQLLALVVGAVKRHVGVQPEVNPATVRIRPLHLRPVVFVLKNAAESAGVGPDLTRVRGDLADALPAPFIPAQIRPQVLVSLRESLAPVAP